MSGGRREIPGFYFDEERNRYFAVPASGSVAEFNTEEIRKLDANVQNKKRKLTLENTKTEISDTAKELLQCKAKQDEHYGNLEKLYSRSLESLYTSDIVTKLLWKEWNTINPTRPFQRLAQKVVLYFGENIQGLITGIKMVCESYDKWSLVLLSGDADSTKIAYEKKSLDFFGVITILNEISPFIGIPIEDAQPVSNMELPRYTPGFNGNSIIDKYMPLSTLSNFGSRLKFFKSEDCYCIYENNNYIIYTQYDKEYIQLQMSADLEFDEFGNPINANSTDSSDEDSDVSLNDSNENLYNNEDHKTENDALILPEDRIYHSTLSSTFEGVETIIATSDAKSLNDPIVEPQVNKEFILEEESLPETTYSKHYMWEMSNNISRVRNISLCGNIHSGKTSLLDMLIEQTHSFEKEKSSDSKATSLRYTDNHILEVKRGISIKSSVMSLLLPDLEEKSSLVNIIDAPGHSNFCDEMSISIRLADAVVLCVDVVESVTKSLELVIEYALKTNTKMTLVITKLDRLILELRLPPLDAYYKIRRTIEQVNETIDRYCDKLDIDKFVRDARLSPELGNVCFASSIFNTIFSLSSFTKKYFEFNNIRENNNISIETFSRKLWGDIYYENKKIFIKPQNPLALANSRTFIKFILTPIYKLSTAALSLDPPELQKFVESRLYLRLKKHVYKLDTKPFFKKVFCALLGPPSWAFVSSVNLLPSPEQNAKAKLDYLYEGSPTSFIAENVIKCDSEGPVVAYVSKLTDTRDSENFYALVRVLSGSIKEGEKVKLLGEDYSINNDQDSKIQKISKCYMWCGRYKINVPELRTGSIGLISGPGIDSFITKTATLYDLSIENPLNIFKGIDQLVSPLFKVSVQAYNPKDLNKFLDCLKKLHRAYVGCDVRVEDSGEHSIFGFGELYMDCLLHDLRILYGDIEIKVSDPMVKFNETTDSLSKVKLSTHSSNEKNSISLIAEPLDSKICDDIRTGILNIKRDPPRQLAKKLRDKYGWDSLAARSIWSSGPDELGTCILCDDTLPDDVDKTELLKMKDMILKGFQWAMREGPLAEEPVSDIKFRIIGASFASEEIDRNGAQIIQMVRKACHIAILIGEPKLLEPIYEIETITSVEAVNVLEGKIERRRGYVVDKNRIEGTKLWKVNGYIPIIESVGVETDLRLSTCGMAYPQMIFNKWERVPGDPLDDTAYIPLLKRVPLLSSSRDFLTKTRRRKGLSDSVSLQNFVDEDTWILLKELSIA
ncbi:hypothetical protein C6P40_002081 [Pichia californica]|uniref:Tr-type G domain-containing protein n=1 Tax=Pichia californica TaxID=460514 RepID=A0A9P6WK90_9ASCO|nr:hypothetical protein C6P40_002081 [[Candida] californica]